MDHLIEDDQEVQLDFLHELNRSLYEDDYCLFVSRGFVQDFCLGLVLGFEGDNLIIGGGNQW